MEIKQKLPLKLFANPFSSLSLLVFPISALNKKLREALQVSEEEKKMDNYSMLTSTIRS
jgi:hypothetical protein